MEQQPNVTFLSDLKKEESVAFMLLQAEVTGPLRRKKASLVMSVSFCLLMAVIALWDWYLMGKLDPLFAVAVPVMLIPAVFTRLIIPTRIKKQAAKAYDDAVAAGNTFSGEVRLYPDRVEKITNVGGTKVPLNGHTIFVETADMLVFLNRFNPAVVLPARCLTEELATAVRQTAQALPAPNHRFISRLQPKGESVSVPVESEPLPTLWECAFTYTAEENVVVMRHVIIDRFWRMAPGIAGISLLGGLITGDISLANMILNFLVFLGMLTVINLVVPLLRVKGAAAQRVREKDKSALKIDRYAIRLAIGEEGEIPIPWSEDVHVYEKGDFAEIAVKRHTAFYLPKRCISDADAFNAVINQCRGKS